MFARTPGIWLGPLRIAVGASWLIAAYLKIVDPSYDDTVLRPALQHWASAAEPFSTFVANTLLPHLAVVAFMLKLADVVVGASLVLGFLSTLGASIGFIIAAAVWTFGGNYADVNSYATAGFIALVTMLFLVVVPAGRVLGIDRALFRPRAERRPREIIVSPPVTPPPLGGATTP